MAALRLFAHSSLRHLLLNDLQRPKLRNTICPIFDQIQKRWSTYKSSPAYKSPSDYTDYSVSRDENEWIYVERLLKPKVVPVPSLNREQYPSGWKPPTAKPNDYPYFVRRNKNYMLPVYLSSTHRGLRKITTIRKIHGDIWALEAELTEHLRQLTKKAIGVRINELSGQIKYRGDYVNFVKDWLITKGL